MIKVSGVSVKYNLTDERPKTLLEYLINLTSRRASKNVDFWALKNVTFSVKRGESIGIIGSNGSGKSTLLKVIAGIIVPTEGEVSVRGKIAPMIELGAGFDPELTGQENIYLNASILGLSRHEIGRRFRQIVDFSEIGDFINSPLRSYSSGMVARLAFSIAVEVEADILIVDEVLSVGDEGFRKKCQQRVDDFRRRGMTLLLVSHGMGEVQKLCENAIWLEKGEIAACGDLERVSRRYLLHFDKTVFVDIHDAHPYKKYIDAMFINGITCGYDVNGRRFYNPENKLSRAEFAVFLSKALGMRKYEAPGRIFIDVPETHWAWGHIAWAFNQGVIDAIADDRGGLHFYPDDYVTSSELVDVLSRLNPEKCRTVMRDDGQMITRGEIARVLYEFFDSLKGAHDE